jgi:hypothetical protein
MLEIQSYNLIFIDKTDFDLGPIEYYFTRFFEQKYQKTITKQELFQQYVKPIPTKYLVRNDKVTKYQRGYQVNVDEVSLIIKILYETNGKSCSVNINIFCNKPNDQLTKVVELIKRDLTEYCEYINKFYLSAANMSVATFSKQ